MSAFAAALLAAACGAEHADPVEAECARIVSDEPALRCELDVTLDAPPRAHALRVGVFVSVVDAEPRRPWDRSDAARTIVEALTRTASILAVCDISLMLQAVHVVSVPSRYATVEGNAPTSWGGFAPASEPDPDTFNHGLDERVVEEPAALFGYAHRHIDDNAIAILVVDDILYHAAQVATPAGGLSFPPIVYHHPDDYPLRNGVLAAGAYGSDGEIPAKINGRTIAHELGHMLLDTAQHVGADDNLMLSGDNLVPAQCALMAANIAALYGNAVVIDPLAP